MADETVEIHMQTRPEPGAFGPCYECRDGGHDMCIGVPCACGCDPVAFLIYTTDERGWGDVLLWWKPGGSGYTRHLEDAGLFTLADAKSRTSGGDNRIVRKRDAWAASKSVVPIASLEGAEDTFRKTREVRRG